MEIHEEWKNNRAVKQPASVAGWFLTAWSSLNFHKWSTLTLESYSQRYSYSGDQTSQPAKGGGGKSGRSRLMRFRIPSLGVKREDLLTCWWVRRFVLNHTWKFRSLISELSHAVAGGGRRGREQWSLVWPQSSCWVFWFPTMFLLDPD